MTSIAYKIKFKGNHSSMVATKKFMLITAVRQYLSDFVGQISFEYNDKPCGIDPITLDKFILWYGDDNYTVDSLDLAITHKFFDKKSLCDIITDIDINEYDVIDDELCMETILFDELTEDKSSFATEEYSPEIKEKVLQYLHSADTHILAGLIFDYVIGDTINEENYFFTKDGFVWESFDVYHFDKYNAKLSDRFYSFICLHKK